MSRETAILLTLVAYKLALIAIGVWANRRTLNEADFFLGGRRLGGFVAALSASASSSSAWTLLGVSGAAYAWGLSALWLFPATLLGFLINWLWIAPRLRTASLDGGSITLTQYLAGDPATPGHAAVVRFASGAIVFSFLVYVASQFQAAGLAFESAFGLPASTSIVIGAAIIVLYTLLGGFWAVSVTDTLQGMLMIAAATALPLTMLVASGGFDGLARGLEIAAGSGGLTLTRGFSGAMAVAFVAGTLGIGLGYPGQPHVVNRFMALRDAQALRLGRIVAITWAVLIYSGMLVVGLCGRALWNDVENGEQILFFAAGELLPPVAAGMMIAAVLSAIMSTADSQLLVAASSLSIDLRRSTRDDTAPLRTTRLVVLGISICAVLIAIYAPASIFSRVLFAWHALGSAFGPALLVRLTGRSISNTALLYSMVAGFGLTVALHFVPDTPGDAAERLIPFLVALAIAALASRPHHDRASSLT